MAQDTRTINARCLCGTFNHDITLPSSAFPLTSHMCHCNSCRHMTAALALIPAFLPASYSFPQSVLDKLKPFAFSSRLTQYFCPTCGAQLVARVEKDANSGATWDVMSGALERLDGVVEFSGHDFLHDTIDGGLSVFLPSIDGNTLQRWPEGPDKGEQLPLGWSSREADKATSSDMLHGFCKCKGTQFYIARPSARSAMSEKFWPANPPSDCSESELPPESETGWLRENRTKFLSSLCVCDSCRLASGMEVISWAFVPPCDIYLDAEGKTPIPHSMEFGTLKHYESSPDVHRYFCNDCGATLFYNADDRRHYTDVAMGLLEAPEGARAESWFSWRAPGVDFAEDADHRAKSLVQGLQKGFEEWQKRKVVK